MATMGSVKKYIITVCLVTIIGILVTYRLYSLWNRFLPDFEVFYFAAKSVLHSHNPYVSKQLFTQFNYPIISLTLIFPFLTMPFMIAERVMLLVNVFAVIGIVFLSLLICHKFTVQNLLSFLIGTLLFFPTNFTFGMGQINLLAYCLLLGAYFALIHKHNTVSSILFSLAFISKPILGFMILFLLFQKAYQIIVQLIIWIGILCIVSVTLFSIHPYLYYFQNIIPNLFHSTGREIYYNQGISGFVARNITQLTLRTIITIVVECVTCALTIVICVITKKKNLLFSFLLTTLLLCDSLSWQHHFVFLLFPFVQYFFSIITTLKSKIYSVLYSVSIVLVGSNLRQPNALVHTHFAFLLSHVFYGTCLLYILFVLTLVTRKQLYVLGFTCFGLMLIVQYSLFISCRSAICLY